MTLSGVSSSSRLKLTSPYFIEYNKVSVVSNTAFSNWNSNYVGTIKRETKGCGSNFNTSTRTFTVPDDGLWRFQMRGLFGGFNPSSGDADMVINYRRRFNIGKFNVL